MASLGQNTAIIVIVTLIRTVTVMSTITVITVAYFRHERTQASHHVYDAGPPVSLSGSYKPHLLPLAEGIVSEHDLNRS